MDMSFFISPNKDQPIGQDRLKTQPNISNLWKFSVLTICFFSHITFTYADTPTLRLVTWNIANFWHHNNIGLRLTRDKKLMAGRSKQTYHQIQTILKRLKPDLIALQEMGSLEAAETLFTTRKMDILFSPRFSEALKIKPQHLSTAKERDIYTALAYNPKQLKLLKTERLKALSLPNIYPTATISPLREPTIGFFQHIPTGEKFWTASVHLKSGCFKARFPQNSRKPSCQKLAKQADILKQWAWQKIKQGENVILMGDFNHQLDRGFSDLRRLFQPTRSASAPVYFFKIPHKQKIVCPAFSKIARPSIDYILISDTLIKKANLQADQPSYTVQKRTISDHCPIQVTLRFKT